MQSARELYTLQIEVERQELAEIPEEEREKLVLIYQAKGTDQKSARRLTERMMGQDGIALDTLVRQGQAH